MSSRRITFERLSCKLTRTLSGATGTKDSSSTSFTTIALGEIPDNEYKVTDESYVIKPKREPFERYNIKFFYFFFVSYLTFSSRQILQRLSDSLDHAHHHSRINSIIRNVHNKQITFQKKKLKQKIPTKLVLRRGHGWANQILCRSNKVDNSRT